MCQEDADHAEWHQTRRVLPRRQRRADRRAGEVDGRHGHLAHRKALRGDERARLAAARRRRRRGAASAPARCQRAQPDRGVGPEDHGRGRSPGTSASERLDGVDRVGGAARGAARGRGRPPGRRPSKAARAISSAQLGGRRRGGAALRWGSRATVTTSSSSPGRATAARAAATWPRCGGSNVPPNSPRARPATARAYGAVARGGGRTATRTIAAMGARRAGTWSPGSWRERAGRPAADLAGPRGAEARRGAARAPSRRSSSPARRAGSPTTWPRSPRAARSCCRRATARSRSTTSRPTRSATS